MQDKERQAYERLTLDPPEANSLHRLSYSAGNNAPNLSIITQVERFDPTSSLVHCISFDGKTRYRGETRWVMPLLEFLNLSTPFASSSVVQSIARPEARSTKAA